MAVQPVCGGSCNRRADHRPAPKMKRHGANHIRSCDRIWSGSRCLFNGIPNRIEKHSGLEVAQHIRSTTTCIDPSWTQTIYRVRDIGRWRPDLFSELTAPELS
jgi:hypothetical protein